MKFELATHGPDATQRLAAHIGEIVQGPLAILLCGDYGCGKTTFVQGLARGIGVSCVVRSPSYNIMKKYEDGRLPLVHADLYRTAGHADIEELGLVEETGQGILAVEWPAADLPELLGLPWVRIDFTGEDGEENLRRLTISWEGEIPLVLGDLAQ